MRVECLGAGHPDTTMSLQQLARCLKDQGKLEECEGKLREALEARERALGEGDVLVCKTRVRVFVVLNVVLKILGAQVWCGVASLRVAAAVALCTVGRCGCFIHISETVLCVFSVQCSPRACAIVWCTPLCLPCHITGRRPFDTEAAACSCIVHGAGGPCRGPN